MINPYVTAPRRYANSPLVERIIDDPKYFLETLVEIVDKDKRIIPFIFNNSQDKYYFNRTNRDIICKPRQLGFCGSPNMQILTADLEWITLRDAKEGQKIVATDEFPLKKGKGQARRLRTSVIEKKCTIFETAFRLTTNDGRELVFTGEHRLLSKFRRGCKYGEGDGERNQDSLWRKVKDFKIGDKIRYIKKPWGKGDFEDGWFGGLIDGEGHVGIKNKKKSVFVQVTQNLGTVFDEMRLYCERKGYTYKEQFEHPGSKTKSILFYRMDEIFKLIGQTRPKKHIGKNWWDGRYFPGSRSGIGWAEVTKIEKLPEQEMIDLQTSTGTYIAEGFVSHNSTEIIGLYLHDTLFVPNTVSVLVAQTEKDATDLFSRAEYMFASVPDEFKPHTRT